VLRKITSALGIKTTTQTWPRKNTPPFGFHGGLRLNPNKRAFNSRTQWPNIVDLEAPELLIIPLINYQKQRLTPQVHVSDVVKRGQALASGIVSPASGTVESIEQHEIIHPGGLQSTCIVIRNDELDTPINTRMSSQVASLPAVLNNQHDASWQNKIEHFVAQPNQVLDQAALQGLGGAGFPTAQKLLSAEQTVQTLIINAAECEPEIACDEALMQSSSLHIAYGISALVRLTQCEKCIVAIEDTKTRAIEAMRNALDQIEQAEQADRNIELMIIPTRYPAGAESPLIQNVTGQFIPHNEKPISYGTLLDSRVVSLGGASMPNPCNVRVRFGTPISYVLERTSNTITDSSLRIRAGGPLSGFDLQTTDVPITATTNCILVEAERNEPVAQPCIRCDDCADVCPALLQPQQLYWHAQAAEHDKCEALQLDACIECGCCDLVCPASIKLTETFRFEKSNAHFIQSQKKSAADAELRFLQRENRLELRSQARQKALEQRKENLKSRTQTDQDKIKAALTRVRAKRGVQKD